MDNPGVDTFDIAISDTVTLHLGTSDFSGSRLTAIMSPTAPYTITWAPEPKRGQGTTSATYNWDAAGVQNVFATVENCGGFAADVL